MAILHIDYSTDGEENYWDIESPTAAQIREAIQNCGVRKFTYLKMTSIWQFNGRAIKSSVGFTRGIKNRFMINHHIDSVSDKSYSHLHRFALDPALARSERRIPIVLDNGEMNYYPLRKTVDIEVAIAIAKQFAEQGTFPDTVEWSSPPQFEAYLQSLDTEG